MKHPKTSPKPSPKPSPKGKASIKAKASRKASSKAPTSTSDLLRLKQVERIQLSIDRERGALISRDLVRTEWEKHIVKFFQILDKSIDGHIYNSVVKEMKSYLRDIYKP